MSIHVALNHKTEYLFDRPVHLSPHVIRLRPAAHTRTPVLSYSMKIHPKKHFINWQQDPFGNWQARLVFPEKTRKFSVEVDLVADMVTINPFDFYCEDYADRYPFLYEGQLLKELAPYLQPRESGPHLMDWLREVDRGDKQIVDFLVEVNQRLQHDIGYVIRMEPGVQSCEQTLGRAKGSCRDSAHLLVQILRHLGLAARFVSGYLVQLSADVKSLDGPSGPESDFTDLHAWTEVYVPGAGWLGLDPTSGLFAGEGHIPLACTPDPSSAAPITGAVEKCETQFYFHNEVTRIKETARVTKPYSEEQWQAILRSGEAVDQILEQADVRLTMGGEPTFVSIDDMEAPEWNTEALGEHKRSLAGDLVRRLRGRFAHGGLLHFGQGKWYPGEPLPRWALNCYWRRDGEALWRDPALFAAETEKYHFNATDAKLFLELLAEHLGVAGDAAIPAYEDVFYYLWKEGRLPVNVDPLDAKLKDPLERARLRRLFQQGVNQVIGYALPLKWQEKGWKTGAWSLRDGLMFLLPGDSPMGLRLPLDSLPWEAEKKRRADPQRDPFEPRSPLQAPWGEVARRYIHLRVNDVATHPLSEQKPADETPSESELVRSALCVEPRHGVLHIFLPPLTHAEHFIDLIASIETTASALQMPVVLEGYEPPRDERLLKFSVTPDPGVIEVNVQPAQSWKEMVEMTETLYEEAHYSRLGTEKFMLDGRHSGTGGGNHVTMGAASPTDSPFLRRPDLLRSLITFWQHHPSLSYLFSGLFIGPTSQAPRIDEARDDSLYNLEIAFAQIPQGEAPAPWLVDRIMRNLLADMSGNTHRAEFCIDKLYSPDSASGRQGLVEFRAFEMPPHARMSLVQMLLLRALVAQFWNMPYRGSPVRWGTALHDRFLLPHFVWQDLSDVVCGLRDTGYEIDLEWFRPFFEFRFPRYGQLLTESGIELELRSAIEPWNVLAEEITSQGTARFVDSSVERVQIKVKGMVGERHYVTCNGRRVPLRPTGKKNEYVAGVRFKAWQPPSGLHPTIPDHNPLVIDLVDGWNQRSIAGCNYFVDHPGGKNPDTFPINANEAESRRVARFRLIGHTPGRLDAPPDEPSNDHPYTLDLRYRNPC
jgi:uncharacterized protein (DUF2126 family)/transglutaminase-like putative cysteine protease